ncbi:MAG: hypothetical protein WDM90_24030 [Ferruginibacter sp.]
MKQLFLAIFCAFLLQYVQAQDCPKAITVTGPTERAMTNKPFQFVVDVQGLSASVSVSYNWSVSSGTIVSGQGTPSIMVEGKEAGYCAATVEIGGLPQSCHTTASATADIQNAPQKILTITTVANKTIQDSVKSFIKQAELKDATIYQEIEIKIYAVNEKEFNKIKVLLDKAFELNEIYSYQYTIINGGIKKTASIEMYRTKKS